MGLFRRCKEQWALVKEMRTMFKAEWERAKRWHAITQAEAETLSDEELWDCITSRLPQVEEPEEPCTGMTWRCRTAACVSILSIPAV